ncbi:MAG: hypothetical protein IPO40_08185 [Fibrobacteres bacterium]|nr:hypothetical protein [Fibrobacterota bacterium]
MIVCVHDANILIDLAKSGLIPSYAKLGWITHVPDLVLREVKQALDPWIRTGVFRITTFDGTELLELLALQGKHSRRLSLQDTSALYLARKLHAPLLTGDGALRKAAERDGIDCRGLLWIMDRLLEAGEASDFLAECLEAALVQGARLPLDECEKRLVKWRSQRKG